MKHIFRDCFIAAVSYLGIVWVYRTHISTQGPLVRILCFHDVNDAAWFEDVLRLCSQEFHVLTPDDFHQKRFSSKKINILLTFDDGYQSWVDVCMPVLEKYYVKGLFFISSGLLDVATKPEAAAVFVKKQLLLNTSRQLLSWEGAAEIVTAKHTIGGHTANHHRASTLENEEFLSEVETDKLILEEKLKTKIVDFAYPFGGRRDYTESTNQQVKKVGYEYLYSAEADFVSEKHVVLPRLLLASSLSIRQVRQWVLGGYDIFSILKNI